MRIYRFTHKKHAATAWSGQGGLKASGRWHTKGRLITHASESAALAVLETLVHATSAELVDFRLHVAELPDALVTNLEARLPARWDEPVHQLETRALGDEWLATGGSVALRVPSSLLPGWNILLNPAHAAFARVRPSGAPVAINLPARLT